MKYAEVQKIAKDTIEFIKTKITAGMKLTDIRQLCEDKMLELGADSFWYWDIGAFVFSGSVKTGSIIVSSPNKNVRPLTFACTAFPGKKALFAPSVVPL